LPRQFTPAAPWASQRLLVERKVGDDLAGPLPWTQPVAWSSSNDQVVVVEDGIARGVGNGSAVLTVRSGDQSASVRVTVRGMKTASRWEFSRHAQPILARQGCNSGACHGALAGKGGFRLSLRGYDSSFDHWSITRHARGRRVELADPGRSLILAKPTAAIRHKGGARLEPHSLDYRILSEWIADGAPPPTDDDAQLETLSVYPRRTAVRPGQRQQIIVRAMYSDGRQADVTRWAKFSSTDETVVGVDESGVATILGHGEGSIAVWFASRIVLARVTSPFPYQVKQDVYDKAPRRNFIDERSLKKLASLNLAPSPRCTDAEFLRRASLDAVGTLPTAEQAQAFLADKAPDKRDRLIESLLARKEFVDYWTFRWSDLLLVNGRRLRPDAVKAYHQWIRDKVEKNAPWDRLAREIITAKGSSVKNGATNFYALHQTPEDMSENVSQAFLGLSIGCARCHNHPLEKWTNDQYYSMANLFARVRVKGWGGDARNGDGKRTLYVADAGDVIQPRTGKPQPPAPLDSKPLAIDDPSDRRELLADWVTSPDNPYFTRAIANRAWANFFGLGLVNQVDDLRASNPASDEELLNDLARYVVDHKFDLKQLIRLIMQSETYQRSSVALPENKADKKFFSRYYPRRLMAEVLLDAVAQVSDVPSQFNKIAFDGADIRDTKEYPQGTRAIQLYDSAVLSPFLKTFGRNERNIVCECERSNTPSMVQVLHLSNGSTINDRLGAKGSCVDKAVADWNPQRILDRAYLTALSRLPTVRERKELTSILNAAAEKERREVVEDLYWGIMSSREFLFNH
ncbi:MAG: DUF1553 domain-containing protein, partial [Planctomycetales bacterium]